MPNDDVVRFPTPLVFDNGTLSLSRDEAQVEFDGPLTLDEVQSFVAENRLSLVEAGPGGQPPPDMVDLRFERCWVGLPAGSDIDAFAAQPPPAPRLRAIGPVYHWVDHGPRKSGLTYIDRMLVAFVPTADPDAVSALIAALETVDVTEGTLGLPESLRLLRLIRPASWTLLPTVDRFAASPLVRHAEVDWAQMHAPFAAKPNDPMYAGVNGQWNLERIGAEAAWDVERGSNAVTIAIIDSGCDLTQPDLRHKYTAPGNMSFPGFPVTDPYPCGGHGTRVAGVAAAHTNNLMGVAGAAWDCMFMPVRIGYFLPYFGPCPPTSVSAHVSAYDVAKGIHWARQHAADVANFSLDLDLPYLTLLDEALKDAHAAGIVLVGAAGNASSGTAGGVAFPASHPAVIAVGASDAADGWLHFTVGSAVVGGSQFGRDLDFVAPGLLIPSTTSSSGPGYEAQSGTSFAAPQVAGLAALLRAHYPNLGNEAIRALIARTAERTVAGMPYAHVPGYPHGTRSEKLGYGRINMHRALDHADVFIRDNPADTGVEPTPGDFFSASDIVVRQADDGVFAHQPPLAGQDNWVYVRAANLGPAVARNVSVRLRAVPYAGTEFVHPYDWEATDGRHIAPLGIDVDFPTAAAGRTMIARFQLTAAMVANLIAFGHPCLLAEVRADNDYATPLGSRTWLNNNLAQRNLSFASAPPGIPLRWLFVFGHPLSREPFATLSIDRAQLPPASLVHLDPYPSGNDRDRLPVPLSNQAPATAFLHGAVPVTRSDRPSFEIVDPVATIGFLRSPGQAMTLALSVVLPADTPLGAGFSLTVVQRDIAGQTVGGATLQIEVAGSSAEVTGRPAPDA